MGSYQVMSMGLGAISCGFAAVSRKGGRWSLRRRRPKEKPAGGPAGSCRDPASRHQAVLVGDGSTIRHQRHRASPKRSLPASTAHQGIV
jgi:hypothetical protein